MRLVSFNSIETANPSRGGGPKLWICQADAYRSTDRQTGEIKKFGGSCLKEVSIPHKKQLYIRFFIDPIQDYQEEI